MTVNEKDVIVDTTPEGVRRAATEKYAFLMESSQIEYEVERQCSLTQIGKNIDDKGYGIAMKKGRSSLRKYLIPRKYSYNFFLSFRSSRRVDLSRNIKSKRFENARRWASS
jgi:hypothetical protein